jgi:transcriptional regulator with XRE-family HTH domain
MGVSHNDVHSFHRQGVEDINETYIGHKLKSLRIEHGLKQSELADALCVSTSTISHWEKGRRIPSLVEIGRIADHFGVAMRTLIEPPDASGAVSYRHHDGRRSQNEPFIRRISSGQIIILAFSALFVVLGTCTGDVLGTVLFVSGIIGLSYVFIPSSVQSIRMSLRGTGRMDDRESTLVVHVSKEGTDSKKIRSAVLSFSTVGAVFLIMALVFHVIALLHEKDQVTTPLVMSLTGFILLWVRTKTPSSLDAVNPFVGRVSSEDRRLTRGQKLLLGVVLFDALAATAIFMTSGNHQAFRGDVPFACIPPLFLLGALVSDIVALSFYQRFLDGFHVHDSDKRKGDDD